MKANVLKFVQINTMLAQEGGGDSDCSMNCTRWTPGFQDGLGNILGSGEKQDLLCPSNKWRRDILAALGQNLGPAGEGIKAVSTHQISSFARSGKTAKLFWTTGNPGFVAYERDTLRMSLGLAGIAGAESNKTGTYQYGWGERFNHAYLCELDK